MVHHITLHTEHSPCEASEDYSYADCVNRKVAQSSGCQLFWTKYTGVPVCSNLYQLSRYVQRYDKLVNLEKNKLLVESGCLRPCSYMEYSVGLSWHRIYELHQILENIRNFY